MIMVIVQEKVTLSGDQTLQLHEDKGHDSFVYGCILRAKHSIPMVYDENIKIKGK